MDPLRIFLYFLLLMTALMALSVIIAFVDGSIWSQGNKLLRSIGGVVVILSPVTVFYTLFVDEDALIWVGVSFILFFSIGLLLVFTETRDVGISWAHIRAFIREQMNRLRNADRLVRLPGQETLPTDEHLRARQLASKLGLQLKPKSPEGSLGHDLRTLGVLTIVPLLLFFATIVVFKNVSLARIPPAVQPMGTYAGFFIALMVEQLVCRAIAKNSQLSSAVALSKASYVTAHVMFGCAWLAIVLSLVAPIVNYYGFSPDIVFSAGGFGVVSVFVSRTLLKLHVTESMSQAVSRDTRPPVVYLRPFYRESFAQALLEKARHDWRNFSIVGRMAVAMAKFALAGFKEGDSFDSNMERVAKEALKKRNIFGRLTYRDVVQSFASGRGGFFDEQLVLANIFGQIGPYVAIARPGETSTWFDVGAAKQAFSDDKWQEAITHLIVDSAIIVIEAGNSMYLSWELEQVVQLAPPVKVLLLLPKSEHGYANFRDKTQTIFPRALPTQKPSSRFVIFDQSWLPCVLHNQLDSLEDPMSNLSCAPVLRPFFEQNGYTLAEHSETLLKITRN